MSLDQGSTLYGVLRELKFRVTEIKVEQPARLNRLDVLFLRQLNEALDEGEIEEIHHFVERGGTLIVAGDRSVLESLLFDFGLEMRKASKPLETSQRILVAPVFPDRPVKEIFSRTDFAIQPIERDVAPLFGKEMDYSIVTFREGDGRAFFMSCPYIFNDSGLGDDRNATFLYNLMTTLPRRARIGLAESHYYAFGSIDATNPLIHLLFKTPVGLGGYLYRTDYIPVSDTPRETIRQATSGRGDTQSLQFRVCPRHDRSLSKREHPFGDFEADSRYIPIRPLRTVEY